MLHTFHLTFARTPGDTSLGTFVATLFDAETSARAERTIVVPAELQQFAMQLAKGGAGKPDPAQVNDSRWLMVDLLVAGPPEGDEFLGLARSFLSTAGARLAVHLAPGLRDADRGLLENLPWSAVEDAADGRLRVVLHAPAADPQPDVMPELRAERRRTSKAQAEDVPALRVLVVIGSLDQGFG